jgi:hypothetical protein
VNPKPSLKMQIKREWLQLGGSFFWNFSRRPMLIRSGGGHYNYHRRRYPGTAFRVCTDEENSVIRSAMDALRYLKKNNYPFKFYRSLFIYFFQFDLGCITEARLDILFL